MQSNNTPDQEQDPMNNNTTPVEYKKILRQAGFKYNPGYKCYTHEKFSIGLPITEHDIRKIKRMMEYNNEKKCL